MKEDRSEGQNQVDESSGGEGIQDGQRALYVGDSRAGNIWRSGHSLASSQAQMELKCCIVLRRKKCFSCCIVSQI